MTKNKQLMGVEWYDNEIGKLFDQFTMGKIKIYEFQNQRFKLEKQAKEMERQQAIDLHYEYERYIMITESEVMTFGQFYKKIYGGGK